MYSNNKKTIIFVLILISVFFCNCQTKTETANVSNQKNETKNQTAIRVSTVENDAAEPAIAADFDGNFYVVYVEHGGKDSADIYLQKFDKNEKQIGEKVRVNPEKGIAKAWFGDPPTIKIGSDNAIFIGWTAKVELAEKSSANVLNLSVSRDGGKTFNAPVKVNDDSAPASHGMHSLEIGDGGKVFMAWLDERNVKSEHHAKNFAGDQIVEPRKNNFSGEFQFVKTHHDSNENSQDKTEEPEHKKTEMSHENAEPNSEIFFTASSDGGKTFSKNIKLSSEICPCCKTNLAIDNNGKIYASWRQVVGDNFRHIAVASSENGGANFSNPVIVSDDQWQINACPVSGAPMFIDDANNLKIFWYTAGKAGKAGFYNAESNDGGKSFSPRNLIYEGMVKGTASLFGEKNFGAVFEENGKIYALDQNAGMKEKTSGELPSAVAVSGAVYVAFIKKENEKSGIWLEKF